MSFAHKISGKNRARKFYFFYSHFCTSEQTKILDVGYSDKEYSPNDNYLEQHYPYPKMITALGVDDPKEFPKRYPDVKAIKYNGTIFPFADKKFDIVWSNAVIEHVGGYEQQLLFLKEMLRVGKQVYFTTPNRFFPIEVHTRLPFFHWLPKQYFDFIAKKLNKGWATGKYMHLLSQNNIERLLSDADVKRYKIVHNKFLLFTIDFAVII